MTRSDTRDAPAFDFYPERWLVGTAAMTDAEQISYLRLLCHQWMNGDAGLPDDAATLRRLAGKGCTAAVRAKFPAGADGRLRNRRLEILRHEQRERIRKRSEQRRTAARKRWHGDPAEAPLSGAEEHGYAYADEPGLADEVAYADVRPAADAAPAMAMNPALERQAGPGAHLAGDTAAAGAFLCPGGVATTGTAPAAERGLFISMDIATRHEKTVGNDDPIQQAPSAKAYAAASSPQCGSPAHHPPPTTHPIDCTSVESTRGPAAAAQAAAPGVAGAGTAARSRGVSPPCDARPLVKVKGGEMEAPAKPALDDVKAYAPEVGAAVMCAEHFWNECQAAGWRTRHGQRIVDWQALFRNYASTWKSLEARRSPAGRWKGAGGGKAGRSGTRPRSSGAYTVESATRGLSGKDIGEFCPDQK